MFRSIAFKVAMPGLLFLASCANINTIDRTTYLEDGHAKAVHLDVQQRLLIVNNMGRYCAEPSPDALAAYAASLGVGASSPGAGAASLSGAGQSTAASIGLRTQSITLMRDALYRMCEAYGNGAIGEAQVVTLLNRSQDLTAVILAVEQLTGAVAANQAALTGSAGASSFATALNNSKLLAEATAHEERQLRRLSEAQTEQTAANQKHEEAKSAVTKAEAALKTQEEATEKDEKKIAAAQTEVTYRIGVRDAAFSTLKSANDRVELYRKSHENAQEVTAEIAKTPNSSSASSTASTSSSGQFSTPISRAELSKEATVAIAGAVKDIVTTVLEKDYVLDSCMSVITTNRLSTESVINEQEAQTRDYCQRLVSALIEEKAVLAETKVQESRRKLVEARITSDSVQEKQISECLLFKEKREKFIASTPDSLRNQKNPGDFTAEKINTLISEPAVSEWWGLLGDDQRKFAADIYLSSCR